MDAHLLNSFGNFFILFRVIFCYLENTSCEYLTRIMGSDILQTLYRCQDCFNCFCAATAATKTDMCSTSPKLFLSRISLISYFSPIFCRFSHRYGRVQSVKILLSSNCNPNLLLSIGSSSVPIKDHNDSTDDHTISMYNFNNNFSLCSPTTNLSNCTIGSVCATVAFMDIKSASKAHTAEHKFDDRVLTTEYYEPSSIPSTSGENSPSSISSLTNTITAQQQQATAQQQPSPQHGLTTSNLLGTVQQSVQQQQQQQQYSSSSTVSPPAVAHRLSTSNHG